MTWCLLWGWSIVCINIFNLYNSVFSGVNTCCWFSWVHLRHVATSGRRWWSESVWQVCVDLPARKRERVSRTSCETRLWVTEEGLLSDGNSRERWLWDKKERILLQFRALLLSLSFFLSLSLSPLSVFTFWCGLHLGVLAPKACGVQRGGELVLPHVALASPESAWQESREQSS